jgi:hypothetical protein
MHVSAPHHQSAFLLRHRLDELHRERGFVLHTPLAFHEAYMADLDEEIATTTEAFVGSAVTEIAELRAQLGGPMVG